MISLYDRKRVTSFQAKIQPQDLFNVKEFWLLNHDVQFIIMVIFCGHMKCVFTVQFDLEMAFAIWLIGTYGYRWNPHLF
jgi:hypothetical protein